MQYYIFQFKICFIQILKRFQLTIFVKVSCLDLELLESQNGNHKFITIHIEIYQR